MSIKGLHITESVFGPCEKITIQLLTAKMRNLASGNTLMTINAFNLVYKISFLNYVNV